MGNDLIRDVFERWTQGLDPRKARVILFEKVRDIPYAYPTSRDPVEVLKNNRGSCSGKHYLLGAMYNLLSLPARHMICTHRFNESPIVFPDEMQDMLCRNEIVDLHDYLQVEVDGAWVDIDATWEAGLRAFGFPVNEDWDGVSPMALSVVPEEFTLVERDPERQKEAMLSKLTPRQRTLRKQFLEALTRWVQELTAEMQRDGQGVSADEIVDVVDADDRVIRRAARADIRRQRLRHRSVYILLFNPRGQIFIHRRTLTKDVYPGYWDVAVGGVVAAGEDYGACARRELGEEVGVMNGELSRLFAIRFEDEGNLVNGMVYTCTTDQTLQLQAEEVEEGRWVELDEVPSLAQTETFCADGLFVFERYRSMLR